MSEQLTPEFLHHLATCDEGGLRWMTGRCMPAGYASVELYAMPGFGRAPALVLKADADAALATKDADLAAKEARIAELCELLRDSAETMKHGDFSNGVCCCGSYVDSHGMGDGHSPVDSGDYYASCLIERIDEALVSQQQAEPCDLVTVPRALFDQAVSWVEDRRRFGDYGTIHSDWLALKAIQRGLPIPAPSEWADAATHSEDGRDICAAGDLRGEFLGCSFSQYRMERGIKLSLDDGVLSILLTDDQPARQVGGDAIKEAFEEGFSEGNRQTDDRYHWKGYHQELAESWETSDAKKAALAPAAVAVVMPNKIPSQPYTTIDKGSKNYKAGWNSAINAFASLNRRAIPEGLIEASRRAADILGSQGFAAWDQLAAELRALLSKGD